MYMKLRRKKETRKGDSVHYRDINTQTSAEVVEFNQKEYVECESVELMA